MEDEDANYYLSALRAWHTLWAVIVLTTIRQPLPIGNKYLADTANSSQH